jgi:hypothetical protein
MPVDTCKIVLQVDGIKGEKDYIYMYDPRSLFI